eukprot:4675462-Pleurochrysis_carterae.AAC.1
MSTLTAHTFDVSFMSRRALSGPTDSDTVAIIKLLAVKVGHSAYSTCAYFHIHCNNPYDPDLPTSKARSCALSSVTANSSNLKKYTVGF